MNRNAPQEDDQEGSRPGEDAPSRARTPSKSLFPQEPAPLDDPQSTDDLKKILRELMDLNFESHMLLVFDECQGPSD